MKALYAAAPGQYGLVDKPKPMPGPAEALVKVSRAALCHTDVAIRDGRVTHVRYPLIPGHEFAGVVEACGSEVHYLGPGDRVAVHTILSCGRCTSCRKGDESGCENYDELGSKRDGGFAEYCVVPARHLYRLPDHVGLDEAALLEPLACAVSAVHQSEIKPGERVVIIGPGPIGLLTLQVARLAHPSVTVLVGTRRGAGRLALGKRLGCTDVLDAQKEGALDTLKDILGGKGADVVIECSGSHDAMETAMQVIGWRGRIALEGTPEMDDMVKFSPFHLLHSKSVVLRGITGWITRDFVQAMELLSSGLVDVKPLTTHVFPLEEWEAAFEMITNRKGEAIKVQFAF